MTVPKQKLIERLDETLRSCADCRLDETRRHVLTGEGPLDARLMLIALSPGREEDADNRMFIGPSGRVLNRLLDHAGIKRRSVYMTNLIKCMLPKNRRPKANEIKACSPYLNREISIIQPHTLVPLGFYATRYILTLYSADLPSARREYYKYYGKLCHENGQNIFPLPHPASLLYRPEFEKEMYTLYARLSVLSRECKWYSCCPMRRYYESGRLNRRWIDLYCQGLWSDCVRYQMEEQGTYHPDYMLPDGHLDKTLQSKS